MIWPFSKKTKQSVLECQFKYGQTDIKTKQGIVALVLDSSEEFGTSVSVKIEDDGRQTAILRVAS